MSIRPGSAADAPVLWAIRTQAIRVTCASSYSADEVAAWSSQPMPEGFVPLAASGLLLVAEVEGVPVAFAFPNPERTQIEGMFVSPVHTRLGIGTLLLDALETLAVEADVRSVSLSSTLNAEAFYRARGYDVLERTSWRHPAGFELASVRMRKALSEA